MAQLDVFEPPPLRSKNYKGVYYPMGLGFKTPEVRSEVWLMSWYDRTPAAQ